MRQPLPLTTALTTPTFAAAAAAETAATTEANTAVAAAAAAPAAPASPAAASWHLPLCWILRGGLGTTQKCCRSYSVAASCYHPPLIYAPPTHSTLAAAVVARPWSSNGNTSQLVQLPSYVNVVCLSLMRPDVTYTGGLSFDGTGLDFR